MGVNFTPGSLGNVPWEFYVLTGQVPGAKIVDIFGINANLDENLADIWNGVGGGVLTPQIAAVTHEVSSQSTDDTAAGIGARTVTIRGLDGNFNEIEEEVTMNGTSTVATAKKYLRINEFFVTSRGTYNSAGHVDTITCAVVGGGAEQALMSKDPIFLGLAARGKSHYTVPAGKIALVYSIVSSVNTTVAVRIAAKVRRNATNNLTTAPFLDTVETLYVRSDSDSVIQRDLAANPIFLDPKCDFWFQAEGDAVTSTICTVVYRMLVMDFPA